MARILAWFAGGLFVGSLLRRDRTDTTTARAARRRPDWRTSLAWLAGLLAALLVLALLTGGLNQPH